MAAAGSEFLFPEQFTNGIKMHVRACVYPCYAQDLTGLLFPFALDKRSYMRV